MITKTKNRAAVGRTISLGLLLATLLAMLVPRVPAGAASTSATAFASGYNCDGQLCNVASGPAVVRRARRISDREDAALQAIG